MRIVTLVHAFTYQRSRYSYSMHSAKRMHLSHARWKFRGEFKFALLIHQQFGVPDNVDEQDVSYLQPGLFFGLCSAILRNCYFISRLL